MTVAALAALGTAGAVATLGQGSSHREAPLTSLDPTADKLLTGTAFVILSLDGRLPWWATAIVLVGYFFGQSWGATQHWSERSPLVLVCLLLVAPSAYFAYRWATSHRSR